MRSFIFCMLCTAACASSGKKGGSGSDIELLTYDAETAYQSLEVISLRFPWELQNPSSSTATVGAATWTFTLDGEQPVTGTTEINGEAPAGGKTKGSVKAETTLSTTPEAFAARKDKPGVHYDMVATFKVSSSAGAEEYEAEWHGEIYAPRAPEVKIDAQAGRFGDSGIELNVIVGITNSNPFDVTLAGLAYKLFVDNVEITEGRLGDGTKINAASELQFNINRFLGPKEKPDLAKKLLKAKVIPYKITGTLGTESVSTDVDTSGEIAFSK